VARARRRRADRRARAPPGRALPEHPGLGLRVAHVHAGSGRPAEARRLLDTFALDEFRGLPHDGLWLGAIALLTETAAALGEPRHAPRLHALLQPYADRNVAFGWVSFCGGSASRHLGLLARLLGREDEAIVRLEAALAMNERMRARPLVARTRLELAGALLDRSDPVREDVTRAREHLEATEREAGALGMTRLLDQARAARMSALSP
jgi:hypothetical protein